MNILLEKLRFVLEIPIQEKTYNTVIRHEYASLHELQEGYARVLDTCRQHNQSVPVHSDMSHNYFIRYSIYDTNGQLLKNTFKLANSFEHILELTMNPIMHFFIDGTKYYMFVDKQLEERYMDLINKEGQLESIKNILYCSEYVDTRDFGLHMKQTDFFDGVPINFRFVVDVYSTKDSSRCFHIDSYCDASQMFESYNVLVSVVSKDGRVSNIRLLEHVYPYSITNPQVAFEIKKEGGEYRFINSCITDSSKIPLCCSTVYIAELFSSQSWVNIWNTIDVQSVASIKFSWKGFDVEYVEYTGVPYTNHAIQRETTKVKKGKGDDEQRKLSQSINENYVDNIEEQLKSILIPSVVKDDPVVQFAGTVKPEKYVPEWVSFYYPSVIKKKDVYVIVPRHNNRPSIRAIDRVLYDYKTDRKMVKPIYWNEQIQAWTSTIENRNYIEYVFENNITEYVEPANSNKTGDAEPKKRVRRNPPAASDSDNESFQPRRSTRLATRGKN